MIGTTKVLTSFTSGVIKIMDVRSSLSNVIISNKSNTETISVTMKVSSAGDTAILLSGVKIPPNVSLQVLEGEPLRVKKGKAGIEYVSTLSTGNLMDVTYTSA